MPPVPQGRGQGTGNGASGQRTADGKEGSGSAQSPKPEAQSPSTSSLQPPASGHSSFDYELVVLGAGPGGYTAAFRAADLGLKVALIERWPTLGGVCLNVGCIPSKALLHAAKVIEEAESMAPFGITFGHPAIDAGKLRDWKNKVIGKLTGGLAALAKQRKVDVIRGVGKFVTPHEIESVEAEGAASRRVSLRQLHHCSRIGVGEVAGRS